MKADELMTIATLFSGKREDPKCVARRHHQILTAAEHKCRGAVADHGAHAQVPKRATGRRVVSHDIARRISTEKQMSGGGENAGKRIAERPAGIHMPPGDVSGAIVNGFDYRFRRTSAATASIALRLGIVVGQVRYAVALLRVYVKQAGFGVGSSELASLYLLRREY